MTRKYISVLALALGALTLPAGAASFDCARATTPFENAICDIPDLSAADERLAKAFATATGGLTKPSVNLMRADQRNWLDFAQRACTDNAEPLLEGSFDEDGGACLVEKFNGRIDALEQSRMISGHRFLVKSVYAALPDPEEVNNPDSYWKVASHEMVLPLLDDDDALAERFNAYVMEQADALSDMMKVMGGGEISDLDGQSDISVNVDVQEVVGTGRISLTVNEYAYGHGAAHGNYFISYRHYLVGEARGLLASDVFAGENWEKTLADAAWAKLQAEHKEWLQVSSV
ncbi:MAG TPA: lysozyme inhibitor LprI family protein, partial [Devosia sp.]